MPRRKKIAIYMCGQPRMLDVTWKTIKGLFPNHRVDIYCHFWEMNDIDDTARFGREYKRPPLEDILPPLQPISCVIEKQIDFSSILPQARSNKTVFNVLSHYYSFSQLGTIINKINGYDFVLKTRSDCFFDLENSHEHLLTVRADTIFCNPWGRNNVGDFHWFGRPETMLKFSCAYNTMTEHIKTGKIKASLNSHSFAREFLTKHNIFWWHHPFHSVLTAPEATVTANTSFPDVLKEAILRKKKRRKELGLIQPTAPAPRGLANNPNRTLLLQELYKC